MKWVEIAPGFLYSRECTVRTVIDAARREPEAVVGVYRDGNLVTILTPDEAEAALLPEANMGLQRQQNMQGDIQ